MELARLSGSGVDSLPMKNLLLTFTLLVCFSVNAFAQDNAQKQVKQKDNLFGQSMLYPENITLSDEGVPQALLTANSIESAFRAFHAKDFNGREYVFFQVDVKNNSKEPYRFRAEEFRLTNDKEFSLAQLNSYNVAVELAGMLNVKPPPPPPQQRTETTTVTTTTGNVDPYGNVRATSRSRSTTQPNAGAQTGAAVGNLVGALILRSRMKKIRDFIEELGAYSFTDTMIMSGEKQRIYLSFMRVQSKYYDLKIPAPHSQTIRFFKDKPKK
jgi:lipopolysaccharide export system protein LptC